MERFSDQLDTKGASIVSISTQLGTMSVQRASYLERQERDYKKTHNFLRQMFSYMGGDSQYTLVFIGNYYTK